MPKPKRRKTVDDELLLDLETAVAKGADTNRQMAKALGWSPSAFKNYRYGKGNNPRYQDSKAAMETAIKKGQRRRRKKLLALAEDAIAELLRHDTFEEKHVERRTRPAREGGGDEVYQTVQKVVVKRRIPNPIIAMFAAVNASQGTDEDIATAWRSINRIAERMGQDKGAILAKMDEMLKQPGEESGEALGKAD